MALEVGICERSVAEVYPSLWTRRFPRDDRDGDEQAAYAAAAWLQRADHSDSLSGFLKPVLTAEERGIAKIEGVDFGSNLILLQTTYLRRVGSLSKHEYSNYSIP
jgi:hypothetical protein